VYDGASEVYHPLTSEEKQITRQHYTEGRPYFVFIGSLHPRKNLANLFRAFDLFKKTNPSDVQLIIVGARKWWTSEIDRAYQGMNFSNDVIFTGRLNTDHLHMVLGSALGLATSAISKASGFRSWRPSVAALPSSRPMSPPCRKWPVKRP